jgi:hypothetical protein
VEAWSMFVLLGFGTIIVQRLAKYVWYSPDINDYLGPNILIGIFVGGLMFIAVKLIEEALVRRGPSQQV